MTAGPDLVAAGVVAWLLVLLGRRTFGTGAGIAAACLFLLLGNPALQRLGGVRVRAQCETFIAVAVAAAGGRRPERKDRSPCPNPLPLERTNLPWCHPPRVAATRHSSVRPGPACTE